MRIGRVESKTKQNNMPGGTWLGVLASAYEKPIVHLSDLIAAYTMQTVVDGYNARDVVGVGRRPPDPGPLIRIRRSTDNAEIDLVQDAATGAVVVNNANRNTPTQWLAGSTARVVTWYDQTSNPAHVTAVGTNVWPWDPTFTTVDDQPMFTSWPHFLGNNNAQVPGVLFNRVSTKMELPGEFTICLWWRPVCVCIHTRPSHRSEPPTSPPSKRVLPWASTAPACTSGRTARRCWAR